jgi:hypothetical protein
MDQLAAIFGSNNTMPECIVLINTHEWQSQVSFVLGVHCSVSCLNFDLLIVVFLTFVHYAELHQNLYGKISENNYDFSRTD